MKNSAFDLSGKIALVTGGGTGIGLAISKLFHQFGAKVVICGRREQVLKQAVEQIGTHSKYYIQDLTELTKLPGFVSTIEQEVGPLDILVNNAGIHLKKTLFDVTDEEYEAIMLANQKSVFSLTREVSRYMRERKKGSIIMICSMASLYGIPKVIAYTATKSAAQGMTRGLAAELSPLGIRVNCIAPGFIATDMSAKALNSDPERKNKVLGRTPMGRLGEPEDIGYAVLFLSSDAAKYITGVVLPVDGGNSIGF